MNFHGDFIRIGALDIEALCERVLAFTEADWTRDQMRQKSYEAHKDTTTIPLIFDTDFRHTNPTTQPAFEPLKTLLEPVYALIRRHYNQSLKLRRLQSKHGTAYPVRTLLTRLRPGGVIIPHMDRNFSLTHAHRIHMPIQTHPDVAFRISGNIQPLKVGEVWEINNRHIHEVENRSPIPRIHLIVDWVIPGERCCCGLRLDPKGSCSPERCQLTDNRQMPCDCLG